MACALLRRGGTLGARTLIGCVSGASSGNWVSRGSFLIGQPELRSPWALRSPKGRRTRTGRGPRVLRLGGWVPRPHRRSTAVCGAEASRTPPSTRCQAAPACASRCRPDVNVHVRPSSKARASAASPKAIGDAGSQGVWLAGLPLERYGVPGGSGVQLRGGALLGMREALGGGGRRRRDEFATAGLHGG